MIHRTAPSTALALWLLAGCSIVYDPANHMGGAMDAGSTPDATPPDATPPDATPPDATTADAGSSIDLAEFCTELARGFCANADMCCTTAGTFDVAACETNVTSLCRPVYGLTGTEPTLEYDGVAAYEALQRALALSAACELDPALDFFADRDGLLAGIVGTLPGGSDCTPSMPRDPTRILVAALSCADGQSCHDDGAGSWFCRAPAMDGARCNNTYDSQSGRCERRGFSQVCGPGEVPGTACLTAQECASLVCERTGPFTRECAAANTDTLYCSYGRTTDG